MLVCACAAAFVLLAASRSPVLAADEIAEMKRAIQELMTKNQELTRRLATLEARQAPAPQPPSRPNQNGRQPAQGTPPVVVAPPSNNHLERRVRDLEVAKTAQEDAVRTIIRDTQSKAGPKINEFVTLGGAIEVLGGRSSDFSGTKKDSITLNTAELDLEIRLSDWVVGSMILTYNDGTNVLFPSTSGRASGVDRLTVDRALVTIGDVQRFPLFLKAGRDTLTYGTSTGVHRSDVLSIDNPLTIEIFETKANMVGVGFAFPTPDPVPPAPGHIPPAVRPMVLGPLVGGLAKMMGYKPFPTRVAPGTPITLPPEPPPFYGSLYVYDANTVEGVRRGFSGSMNARVGYQTRGTCGRPYTELVDSWLCPWALDVSVDYLGSVFDSQFLRDGYAAFIPQFGRAPGVAASAKLSFGPFLLVGEWNSAIKAARFTDDAGRLVNITPSAWQVALGYQFNWNPWVETIGAQGSYVALGYSRSQGLSGVIQLIGGTPTRVGFTPESRLTFTAGEWVVDGLRIVIEYSHAWDYPVSKGGTGRQADGIFTALTYVW